MWQVKLSTATLASHMDAGLYPSCSSSIQLPADGPEKVVEDDPSISLSLSPSLAFKQIKTLNAMKSHYYLGQYISFAVM